MEMSKKLELEKAKNRNKYLYLRYNPNHDGKTGRFTSKGGGGGAATGGGGKFDRFTGYNKDGSLYEGKTGRNYGKSNTADALTEIQNGKVTSLYGHLDENGNLTPEREALHRQIIDSYFEGKTPVDGQAELRMMGGGPASGKGSIAKTGLIENFDEEHSVKIDPDDIKAMLPDYAKTAKATDKAASLYHEESSMLAKQIAQIAYDENYNVTYDGTGDGSVGSVMSKVNAAREKGYKVSAVYVTVDTDEAVVRNKKRYQHGIEKYEKDPDNNLPPRLVPDTEVIDTHKKVAGISVQVAKNFDKIELYDNNGAEGSVPVLIATGGNGKDLTPLKGKEKQFTNYLNKGK